MAAKKTNRRPISSINVVPYIDVMLVLLVVFMVTAPLLMQGVPVQLPQVTAAPLQQKDEEPLIVSIKSDGSYYINIGTTKDQQTGQPLADIVGKVAKVLQAQPQTDVLVWGDASVPYGKVVELMSQLQTAGATSVGLVTEPEPAPSR